MCDAQKRAAVMPQRLPEHRAAQRAEVAGRFIEQEHVTAAQQKLEQAELCLLAAAERADGLFHLVRCELHAAEAGAGKGERRAVSAVPERFDRRFCPVEQGEVILRHISGVEVRARLQGAPDFAQERCFACSIVTHDGGMDGAGQRQAEVFRKETASRLQAGQVDRKSLLAVGELQALVKKKDRRLPPDPGSQKKPPFPVPCASARL